MKNPFLIGEQVYLRPLDRQDAPRIVAWLNDPDVRRTLAMHLPLTLHGEEEYIAQLPSKEHEIHLGIALKNSDDLIGVTGLERVDCSNRHAGFGIVIGEKAEWDKGYGRAATELLVAYAFDTLNLNRIWLHVFAPNQRAMTVYETLGFRKEGVLRQQTYREGRYCDTIVMAILADEWRARARSGSQ